MWNLQQLDLYKEMSSLGIAVCRNNKVKEGEKQTAMAVE